MSREFNQYTFDKQIPMKEIRRLLMQEMKVVVDAYGENYVQQYVYYRLQAKRRSCLINVDTVISRELNEIFAEAIASRFGWASFEVEQVAGIVI